MILSCKSVEEYVFIARLNSIGMAGFVVMNHKILKQDFCGISFVGMNTEFSTQWMWDTRFLKTRWLWVQHCSHRAGVSSRKSKRYYGWA